MSNAAPFAYLGILLVVAGAAYWLYRRGRGVERGKSAEASNKVKDKQLQDAVDRPKTKNELADRIEGDEEW